MKNYLFILLLFSNISLASYTLGGYSEFTFNTQGDTQGGRNIISYVPQLGLSTIIPYDLPLFGQSFLFPEIGFIYHTNTTSAYSKTQFYLLLDFGQKLTETSVWRLGFGTFLSQISGDGSTIVLNNGGGSASFYAPKETKTSINTTFDLGFEYSFDSKNALKLMGYVFSPFSTLKRSFSYTLAWVYYPAI